MKQLKLPRYRYLSMFIFAVVFGVIGFIALRDSKAAVSADFNSDGVVNIIDLSILGTNYSKTSVTQSQGDANEDGVVNIIDLSILGSQWGSNGGGGSGELNYPRIAWEGGPNYWKTSNGTQFTKADAAGWDDPNFFPISVFYSKAQPSHVSSLKDAGINTYMVVEHDGVYPITNITSQGMFALPQQDEWTSAEIGNNAGIVGWFISDECEMGYGGCSGTDAQELATQQSFVNKVKSYNDGRFMHANFGNGILRTFWSVTTMDQHVQLMDSASADKYTYTSTDVAGIIDGWHDAPDWPNSVPVARAYSYGWQADQMKRFQNQNSLRPIWTFVETARPYLGDSDPKAAIQPDQIEGAVWSAIIHEARGIAYFQHNNATTGSCTNNYSIVECSNVHTKVKAINAAVKALAPVLNTQSYYNATRTVNGFSYNYFTFNNGTDTMLKTYNGSAYIFASLGMRCNNTTCTSGTVDTTGSKTFTLPDGVNGTSVEVVGENRTIPVVNRKFTDTFAYEYSHHVYKVSL